jgi:hypothetical protein
VPNHELPIQSYPILFDPSFPQNFLGFIARPHTPSSRQIIHAKQMHHSPIISITRFCHNGLNIWPVVIIASWQITLGKKKDRQRIWLLPQN